MEISEHTTTFEDQSSEKFINELPIRTDLEDDDAGDEVNIDQYEAKQSDKKSATHHDHHHEFHFHGGNRICCSAHRKHDPYHHVGSKVRSFENFGYNPTHSGIQVSLDKLILNNKIELIM